MAASVMTGDPSPMRDAVVGRCLYGDAPPLMIAAWSLHVALTKMSSVRGADESVPALVPVAVHPGWLIDGWSSQLRWVRWRRLFAGEAGHWYRTADIVWRQQVARGHPTGCRCPVCWFAAADAAQLARWGLRCRRH